MKVSVIVLTYNQEDTISRTLDSILGQQVDFDYEIIVGDDASTDRTRQICTQYQQRYPERLRIMPQAPNKGVADNYFDCLEAARGEFIADCAGDDRWSDPLKMQRQVRFLESHPEVALIHSAWRKVNAATGEPGDVTTMDFREITPGHEVLLRVLRHDSPWPVHLCTATYRRAMMMAEYEADKALFRGRCAEDISVIAALAASHPFGYERNVTLDYSVGGDSVSNPARATRAAGFYRGSLELTGLLANKYGVGIGQIASGLRRVHSWALYLSILSGNSRMLHELESVRRAIGLRPTMKSRLRHLLHRLSARCGKHALPSPTDGD